MNRIDTKILLPFGHTLSDEELPHISHLYHAKTASEFNKGFPASFFINPPFINDKE